MKRKIPTALAIAGSDSCSGAGIQADLKTFAALGVYGTCALTSITAQNTQGVAGVADLAPEFVALQIHTVMQDIPPNAVKTGMLSSAAIVEAVAGALACHGAPRLVVDPVMVSSTSRALLSGDGVEAMVKKLFPLALAVTPNLHEAAVLAGRVVDSLEGMREAARIIHGMGPQNVVVKGGHLKGPAHDLFFDGRAFTELPGARMDAPHTHGTGCTFAAAIAAGLAAGREIQEAVSLAKEFVAKAIAHGLALGRGQGPVHHFADLYQKAGKEFF